jgi:hypothetical protein
MGLENPINQTPQYNENQLAQQLIGLNLTDKHISYRLCQDYQQVIKTYNIPEPFHLYDHNGTHEYFEEFKKNITSRVKQQISELKGKRINLFFQKFPEIGAYYFHPYGIALNPDRIGQPLAGGSKGNRYSRYDYASECCREFMKAVIKQNNPEMSDEEVVYKSILGTLPLFTRGSKNEPVLSENPIVVFSIVRKNLELQRKISNQQDTFIGQI